MAQMNRIKVVIDGVIYELSSGESAEYIQTVANYIDRKIKNIYSVKSEGAINPSLRTLFISLNIADDLFKERENVGMLEQEASELRKEVAALKEKLEQFEKKQDPAKNESSASEAKTEPEKTKQNHNNKKPAANNSHTPQKAAPNNTTNKGPHNTGSQSVHKPS